MRITRAFLLAVACAVLLPTAMPVQAASCNGASHEMSLSRGTANPGSGSTSTTIVFSVLYTDNAGCVPSSITVTIAGVGTFALAPGATSTAGVTYRRAMTLPAGRHSYAFSATSGSGPGEVTAQLSTVAPAVVTISAPTPQPTPVPTARPTPRPTAAPTVPPPPSTPPPATPTPSPTSSPTEEPSVGPSGSGEPSATESAAPASPGPSLPSTPGPSESAFTPGAGAGSLGPGVDGSFRLPIPSELVAYLVLTAAGIGFFLFLVRRRHAEEGDPAVAAAVGGSQVPGGPTDVVTPLPPMRDLVPPVDPDLLRDPDDLPGPQAGEAGIPRWLRPSVRAARFDGMRDRRYD